MLLLNSAFPVLDNGYNTKEKTHIFFLQKWCQKNNNPVQVITDLFYKFLKVQPPTRQFIMSRNW
jgi:hypothetical protein